MLLLLVRFAFQDVIHTGLAAGDVQVFIVSEQFLAQWKLTGIARPGGPRHSASLAFLYAYKPASGKIRPHSVWTFQGREGHYFLFIPVIIEDT